jgi:inner membrane protein
MDAAVGLFTGLTVWHWVGVGIVLLTLEIAVGTFDLLWVAMAAFVTALFALIVPGTAGEWQGQLVFFGAVAVAFVVMGRTVFKGLRRPQATHPNLNDRMATLIGERGEAASTFLNGHGRVKIGDTVWQAEAEIDGIVEGAAIVVAGADGTLLKVRPG